MRLTSAAVTTVNITALASKQLRPTGIWRHVVRCMINNIPVEPLVSDIRIG